MEIRQLSLKDKTNFFQLIKVIEENLIDKTWWLPIEEEEKNLFFDKKYTTIVGLFDDEGKLVGASMLSTNQEKFFEYAKHIEGLTKGRLGKIGRCMILPKYRGNNYMYQLNLELLKIAKDTSLQSVIAIAHPDNIASNKSLQKLGMKRSNQIVNKEGYLRNIYLLNLE